MGRDYVNLLPGDPAPLFYARSRSHPRYAFHTAAGRYVVLCFFGSAADPHSQAALAAIRSRPGFFDEARGCFFGVTADPGDEAQARLPDENPAFEYFWDYDLAVSRLYGAVPKDALPKELPSCMRRLWVVLDPMLRVMQVIPFQQDRGDIAGVLTYLDGLPPPAQFAGIEIPPPIIILPNVFEPEFCRKLIARYDTYGGQEIGVLREVGGKNVGVTDDSFKRRRDHYIEDRFLIFETQVRFARRLAPEIAKVHHFQANHMERYIIGCYSAEEGGHFEAHRDNTMKGGAHRRFAVTINLNEDYDGGELSFPEYGPRSFKPPVGAALVFSCSLLHAVSRMIRGRRYAFLPFVYDEAAAKLRDQNRRDLSRGADVYTTAT